MESKDVVSKVYWTIGEVAKGLEMTVSHLRSWDKARLYTNAQIIRKGPSRLQARDRRYTSEGVIRTLNIKILTTRLGLSISGVRKAFELGYAVELVHLYYRYVDRKYEKDKTKKA